MEKEIIIDEESFIKRGKMKKSPLLMTPEELIVWKAEMKQGIREYLFSVGQPLVYEKNGETIVEYADGRIKKL